MGEADEPKWQPSCGEADRSKWQPSARVADKPKWQPSSREADGPKWRVKVPASRGVLEAAWRRPLEAGTPQAARSRPTFAGRTASEPDPQLSVPSTVANKISWVDLSGSDFKAGKLSWADLSEDLLESSPFACGNGETDTVSTETPQSHVASTEHGTANSGVEASDTEQERALRPSWPPDLSGSPSQFSNSELGSLACDMLPNTVCTVDETAAESGVADGAPFMTPDDWQHFFFQQSMLEFDGAIWWPEYYPDSLVITDESPVSAGWNSPALGSSIDQVSSADDDGSATPMQKAHARAMAAAQSHRASMSSAQSHRTSMPSPAHQQALNQACAVARGLSGLKPELDQHTWCAEPVATEWFDERSCGGDLDTDLRVFPPGAALI